MKKAIEIIEKFEKSSKEQENKINAEIEKLQ
jgi:hypothetical protein